MARILVVDDDRFFLDLCSDALREEGYEVEAASSAESALELVDRDVFHLVVTDLIMPGMSGIDFLSRIKSKDPSVDVIMVTGNANVETAISALKNGARDYLVKPFNIEDLKHTVATSLEQRRLLEENLELKKLVSLFQAGQAISNCMDLERLYPLVTDSLAKELGAERALGFFRGENENFILNEIRGFSPEAGKDVGELLYGRYLDSERNPSDASCFLGDLSLDDLGRDLDLKEARVFFFRTKNALQGIVVLFNNRGESSPKGINHNRFHFIQEQAALAFDNAIRYASLKSLIYIDELTGLFNYRYLDLALDRELKRVDRYGSNVSVIFLDLDLFKTINDTHGHLIGSKVLKEVGDLIRKSVREVDVVVRYGGDEYTIILSEIGAREAAVVAERIRRTIEGHSFVPEECLDIRLTASLGYACFPEDTRSKQELLEMADQAMYRGKASGKNRVFRASEFFGEIRAGKKEQ